MLPLTIMNPRNYRTWTSFADHPIFTDRSRNPVEWSSSPQTYEDFRCAEFLPEWYIHSNPKLPTDVQDAIAERDIQTFAAACELIGKAFGDINHELFILDDLTVFVIVTNSKFNIQLLGHDYGDGREIVDVQVDEPIECTFYVDAVSEIVPQLVSLLRLY